MSLQKNLTYKGINLPKAYAKVTHVSIVESTPAEDWSKLYKAFLQVNTYTDSTCEFDIEQRTYELDWLTEEQFTLAWCYEGLKVLPDFEWATDV